MDLGIAQMDDLSSSASILTPDEINALLNPDDTPAQETPTALQVLLNQGIDYLANQKTSLYAGLCYKWLSILSSKNVKIGHVAEQTAGGFSYQNPLVYTFTVNKTERGLIAFDWVTAYLLIDGLLGGINGLSIEKKQEQPYSPIEKNVLQPVLARLIETAAEEMNFTISNAGINELFPIQTSTEKRLFFTVKTPVAVGKICLSLPMNIMPSDETDLLFEDNWDVLLSIPLTVNACIHEHKTTLTDVLKWEVGTTLTLKPVDMEQASLICADKKIGHGGVDASDSKRRIIIEEGS